MPKRISQFNPEAGGSAVVDMPAPKDEKAPVAPKKRGRPTKKIEKDLVVPVIGEPLMVIPKEEMKVPEPMPEETKAERIRKIQEGFFGTKDEEEPSKQGSTTIDISPEEKDIPTPKADTASPEREEKVNKISNVPPEKESFGDKIKRLFGYTGGKK